MNITIHKVKTLIVSSPRPRRHGVRQGMAAHLPAAVQVTCKGLGLRWPSGVCPTCGGRGGYEVNAGFGAEWQECAHCEGRMI